MSAALDRAFEATRRRIAGLAWADDIFTAPAPVGIELDGLAEIVQKPQWSPAQRALWDDLRRIEPRQTLAVLSMASNEAPYLAEWIAHHLAIGVEKIFVYTNNNDDGTDEVLRWFARNAPVVPIPVTCARGVNVQQKNYRHALFLLPELRLFDWVAVLDVDEFLLPDARYGHNMRNMLAAVPDDTQSLLFPWHWRTGKRTFERGPGLLAERYGHAVANKTFKCVSRLRHAVSLAQVHFPEFDQPRIMRDSEFNIIPHEAGWYLRQWPGTGGWMEHFWGKSFEEFLIKKRRGETLALDGKPFHREDENFFQWAPPAIPRTAAPWPEAMLAATKARLAQFAQKPGFTALQESVEARYAAYAEGVRNDAALRARYDEMSRRFPRKD
jgi:hypothetical protein